MDIVSILGKRVKLTPRDKNQLKGLTVGDLLSYRFFDGVYLDQKLLFVRPAKEPGSPRAMSIISHKSEASLHLPLVYILDSCPAYFRQRLIDKGVYFVVSDKYAFLPTLIANERIRTAPVAQRLTPVAQYLLLYHLQVQKLDGLSAKEIAGYVPYSYSNVTLGLVCLEDLGLIRRELDSCKRKIIRFSADGKELYDKAVQYTQNPVESHLYCDTLNSERVFPTCSINALSHYSMLLPDPERMIAMSKKALKELRKSCAIEGENRYDGNVFIEVWKYPPVTEKGYDGEWVDKLSLALSLADDHDPRVEKEVEQMMTEIIWK